MSPWLGHRTATVLVAIGAVLALGLGLLVGQGLRRLEAAPARTSGSTGPGASRPATPAVVGALAQPPGSATATFGPEPVADRVAAVLRPLLADASLGASVGASVLDVETGTPLYADAAGVGFTPASTTKLLTAAAILSLAGPDERFHTVVRAGTGPGQIVLVGGGDPTLSGAAAGAPTSYRAAGRLATLAAQVTGALDGQPVTSIVVDDSRFSGPVLAPGWAAEDVPSSYQSSVYPLMIDGGVPADGGVIRSVAPDLEAGRAMARLLGVPGVPVTRGTAAPGARQLGSVDSAPMLDLVEQMLKLSDNVIAELLGREVARRSNQPASFAGAAAAVTAQMGRLGISSGISLVDTSGLSVRNRISPAALTAVLRAIASGAHPALGNIINAMPVAGWDGTLAHRYQVGSSKAGAGRTRAKTGTLTGVTTLAGLVRDATGRLLAFAFLADEVVGPEETGSPAFDAAAAALARCGCR